MSHDYDTINWDDAWSGVLDPFLEAHESDSDAAFLRAEEKYDRYAAGRAGCRLYAERLLDNLQQKNEQYEFAAHSEPNASPKNVWWSVLVRKQNGKPLPAGELSKIVRASRAIVRNIEKKYPGVAEQEREAAEAAARKSMKKSAAAAGYGVRFADEKGSTGCLLGLMILAVLPLGTALAVSLREAESWWR